MNVMRKIFFSIFFLLTIVLPAEADRYGVFENSDNIFYSSEYGYIKNIIIALLFYIIIWLEIKNENKSRKLSCKIFKLENEISNTVNDNKKNKLLKEEYMKDNLIIRENLLFYFDDMISKEELLDETVEVLEKDYDDLFKRD